MIVTVNVENQSSLPDEEVTRICRALSIQGTHHIARSWGLAEVSVQPRPRRGNDWLMQFLDDTDQEGALGYHDWNGRPTMKVFVKTCQRYGVEPSSCASHELAEALCDPDIIRATVDGRGSGKVWAVEVGDPMQRFDYEVYGVKVQDFVLPSWFIPGAPRPYSFKDNANAPFEVPSGGYAQYIDLANPTAGWHQVGQELGAGELDERPGLIRDRG